MPTPILSEYRHRSRTQNFGALYIAVTLLSLHWAVVVYINSSFLGQYVSASAIGLIYTASSAITVLSFLVISRVLHRLGNYKLTLVLTLLEFAALMGMAYATTLRVAIPLFILHQAVVPLILFNLDVYMEQMIGRREGETGGRRGLYLGIMSLAGAIAPLAAGFLVVRETSSFSLAYIAAALLLIPFLVVIIRYFRTFSEPRYTNINILRTLRSFWVVRDVRNIFFAHFLLQLFFTWMVIYTPLYLATKIGFDWSQIGLILFVGLMAYVFIEYPIGIIADRYIGEKEMLFLGFIIMILSTGSIAFAVSTSIGVWMVIMFMTRVGASFVETMTESYFFKHTRGTDANIISFFRITRPLSYVIGALLGSLTLLYLPFNMIFFVLAAFMVPGLIFTLLIKDTR